MVMAIVERVIFNKPAVVYSFFRGVSNACEYGAMERVSDWCVYPVPNSGSLISF